MKKSIETKVSNGQFLIIDIELPSEKHNYFAITGRIYERATYKPKGWDETVKRAGKTYILTGAGCIHENIKSEMPSLQPFIDLHLSGENGVPMHAIENGFYYYQISRGTAKWHTKEDSDREKYFNVLCEHLRISPEQCNSLVNSLDELPNEQEQKIHFATFISTLLPIWKQQANEAIAFFNSIG